MGRYERVNLLAMYRATPFGGTAQVTEWEVKVFEPGAAAANSAFFTSPRDAQAGIREEERRGNTCEGPFPAASPRQ
jgi:hypothetical protein